MGFFDMILKGMASGVTAGQNRPSYDTGRVDIQAMQPDGGTWINVGNADNCIDDGYAINRAMENAQRQFPDHRIRAVDARGRLLDTL